MSRFKAFILLALFFLLIWFSHEERVTVPHAYIVMFLIACTLLVELGWEGGMLKLPSAPPRLVKAAIIGTYLVLSTALVYFTNGIDSKHALIYLLPIISGAYTYETPGSVATSLAAVTSYASLALMLRPPGTEVEEIYELIVNILFFFIVGAVINTLSMRERAEKRKLHDAHEELSRRLHQVETMEEQVRRSERLAALGEMAAGLAHEIRNPLGIIRSATELLGRQPEASGQSSQLTRSVIEEVERLNTVVGNFLDFARPLVPNKQPVDMERLLSGVLALLEPEASQRGVAVAWSPHNGEVPAVEGDETMLRRAFLNLCKNALEAMEGGGTLRVELSSSNPGSPPMVWVEVSDTGPGVPEEIQPKVFNPFFTTKDEGTGLGLTLVHKIVASHGGTISFSSEEGRGTTFVVSLPV